MASRGMMRNAVTCRGIPVHIPAHLPGLTKLCLCHNPLRSRMDSSRRSTPMMLPYIIGRLGIEYERPSLESRPIPSARVPPEPPQNVVRTDKCFGSGRGRSGMLRLALMRLRHHPARGERNHGDHGRGPEALRALKGNHHLTCTPSRERSDLETSGVSPCASLQSEPTSPATPGTRGLDIVGPFIKDEAVEEEDLSSGQPAGGRRVGGAAQCGGHRGWRAWQY